MFHPQMVEESFVSLPGGHASIGKNIPSQHHPVQTVKKALKENRFIEGYDAPG